MHIRPRCCIARKVSQKLTDLAGRKVRTSSVGQSEMMTALGAIPIVIPFSDIVNAVKSDVVDCAITGTMSGGEIGVPNVTSYISPMSISWGLSFFGAKTGWDRLPLISGSSCNPASRIWNDHLGCC